MNTPFSDTTYNLLLIDDDEVDRRIFKRSLNSVKMNYVLHEANNADDGFQAVLEKNFDCIFLDYQLPGTDGLELLNKFKELKLVTGVAILTSHGDESIAIEMLKAGAIDYVNKADITIEKIERIIHSALRIRKAELEKRAAEAALKDHLVRLEAVLESTSSSIFALDHFFRYTTFNKAHKIIMKQLFGVDIYEGQSLRDLHVKDTKLVRVISNIERALNGTHFTTEEEYDTGDTGKIYFEESYNPIRNEHGEVVGVAVFVQDITDKKMNQQALLKARNDAVKAARAKSDFLSNMSHEIRTPMNAIMGITDLLLDKVEQKENRDYLNSIKYSADNLLFIINDILDFSKIEAGKITLENFPFDLWEKLEELRRSFQYKTDEKDLQFNVVIGQDVPQYIQGDPYRLNQILFNLVGNAIKFTKDGEIRVEVHMKKQFNDNCTLYFEVSDTGIGISGDKLETIFESFTQAYTDTSRKFGGTGLGLAITKNLVELQHGTMGVKSEVNKGSTFYFEISYQIPLDHELKTEQREMPLPVISADLSAARSLKGYRLLLVEDNIMNQFVGQQILKKWEAEVNIAENGIEALSILEKHHFDAVLMDLQMPEMNGYEATKRIRENQGGHVQNPAIPIIALTADAFDETKTRVLEAGMNDFVTKPFRQDELFNKIAKYLPL